MTDTPSLALLKGQNANVSNDESGFDGPIEQVEDIKKASAKALEALLAENDTPIPAGWAAMSLADKRKWVLAKFEESAVEAPGEPALFEGEVPKSLAESEVAMPAGLVEQAGGPVPFAGPAEDQPPFEADMPKADAPADGAESKKAKAKSKGKKKAEPGTAVLETKTGEIVEPDILQDIVHEVENMKKEVALSLVAELSEQTDVAFFRLGGVLSVVSANKWWDDGKHKTFREYIEQEHGLEYRKAIYWVSIYNALAKSGVPWAKVKEVGWTKLKEIAKVLTLDNVDTWVEQAKQVNTLTLQDMVKKEEEKGKADGAPAETEKVTTKTFKVHAGQKEVIENAIAKMKQVSGTDVDTVALERICLDYLGGANEGVKTPAQKLAELVKGLDLEVVMHIVDAAFPDFDFVVDKKDAAA